MTTTDCLNNASEIKTDVELHETNPSALSICLYDSQQKDECLALWKTLEEELTEVPLMCSHTWTSTWIEHYGDLIPYSFAVATKEEKPCGICLVTEGVAQFDGPLAINTLHIGTAGEPAADSVCVEYNAILAPEEDQQSFISGLIDLLNESPEWDCLRFDGFTSNDLEAWNVATEETTIRKAESHYFDLKVIRDEEREVISGFGYSTRKNLRKNMKSYGDLTTEWAESIEEAESIFADLVTLHQARWQKEGEPGSYASDRFTAFHKDLIQKLIPTQEMGLFRVKIAGEVVGCVQVLVDRNRVLCYQGGSAEYKGKLSPGVITDYLCIEECFKRGFDAYDFLAGDTHHKQKMSTHHGYLTWAQIKRPRWKFTALNALRKIKQSLNMIKKEEESL